MKKLEKERKKQFFFFWESGPGSQAILRPKKKKKKKKLQRIPRYKRSYILGSGLKPNLQLIAGFRMSGKKMGNWVTKKEAIVVKKGQKIKKEALNLQRVERKEEMWRKKKKKKEKWKSSQSIGSHRFHLITKLSYKLYPKTPKTCFHFQSL